MAKSDFSLEICEICHKLKDIIQITQVLKRDWNITLQICT